MQSRVWCVYVCKNKKVKLLPCENARRQIGDANTKDNFDFYIVLDIEFNWMIKIYKNHWRPELDCINIAEWMIVRSMHLIFCLLMRYKLKKIQSRCATQKLYLIYISIFIITLKKSHYHKRANFSWKIYAHELIGHEILQTEWRSMHGE